MKQFLLKNQKKIAKISLIILFLALIRSLAEPFRLQYYSATNLDFEQVKPYVIGGLLAGTGLLIMMLLYFYQKYKAIMLVALLIIIAMLIVKEIYLN